MRIPCWLWVISLSWVFSNDPWVNVGSYQKQLMVLTTLLFFYTAMGSWSLFMISPMTWCSCVPPVGLIDTHIFPILNGNLVNTQPQQTLRDNADFPVFACSKFVHFKHVPHTVFNMCGFNFFSVLVFLGLLWYSCDFWMTQEVLPLRSE